MLGINAMKQSSSWLTIISARTILASQLINWMVEPLRLSPTHAWQTGRGVEVTVYVCPIAAGPSILRAFDACESLFGAEVERQRCW